MANCTVYLLCLLFAVTYVQADSWETMLLANLTTGHEPEARPVQNHTHPVSVTIDVALAQIIAVDSRNQQLRTSLWIRMYWTDELMTWNSSDWGDTTAIRISSERIWRPDILVYNSLLPYGSNFEDSEATIYSDGSVAWLFPLTMLSTCSIDVTYFPYDEQTCTMQFGSWSFDGLRVDIHNKSATGDIGSYKVNEEWELVTFDARRDVFLYSCCPEPYPSVTFSAFLRRRSLFYNVNVIAPCFLFVLVSMFGFLVPAACGEKLSLGVTVLLALVVFMQVVNQSLPITSRSVPYVGQFFGATIVIVAVSVSFSAFGIMFHFHELNLKKPPAMLKTLLWVPGYRIWERCGKKKGVDIKEDRPDSVESDVAVDSFDELTADRKSFMAGHVMTHMSKIDKNLQAIKDTADENQEQESLQEEWRFLATQLDKVLLISILLVYFITSASMFLSLPPGLLR
ncbi:neuronal acetylcholine receptor subunit alpha-7-like [Branchiostoma lanceolatum]|uniref:CHRNA7 protein n=1 Tax=Branchiostoma lanceolatum TaxID=7740 RepID=A0A8J9V777_BRALA|nr:CHRNA7 [Branchiostoma lanceolatum]